MASVPKAGSLSLHQQQRFLINTVDGFALCAAATWGREEFRANPNVFMTSTCPDHNREGAPVDGCQTIVAAPLCSKRKYSVLQAHPPRACSDGHLQNRAGRPSILYMATPGLESRQLPVVRFRSSLAPPNRTASRRKSRISVSHHRLMGLFLGLQRERPGRCTPNREDC